MQKWVFSFSITHILFIRLTRKFLLICVRDSINVECMGEKKIKYLTLEEAAEHSRISVSALRQKIVDKLLPAYKPGKSVLIDINDLELFIKRSRVT